MLRQAENRIRIEGILSEIDLKYGSFNRNGENVETIGGTIKVMVEQNNTVSEIPVHMFATRFTKAGTESKAYLNIEEVMKSYVSIAACGSKEQADKVRLTNAELRVNEFIGRDGRVVSQPRVSCNFASRAIGDFKPEASFSIEFCVSELKRVVDADGVEVEPAKLEVTGIVPMYGGKVAPFKFYATTPSAINGIESYWEAGGTYKASGYLNFSSTTQTFVEEVDFGEPIKRTRTTTVNEFVIMSGSQALEGEFAFDVNDIRAAMAERNVYLENLKSKNAATPTPAKNGTKGKLDLGF